MTFFDIVKSFIPLVLILGLLFGVLVLVRKYSFSLSGKKQRSVNVDVIYNQLILPKKYLSLIRVQDKLLVLGISESSITLLKELDYNSYQDSESQSKDNKPNFVDLFKQNLGMK
ncbi:MAG: flagellar biosynthetic protein FliO [Ignavibacteriales bacterium]|nr:flagellar biosynthetic protein FliO [Ignavibacteriales bacterium]